MRTIWVLAIAVMALALLAGCSDRQREAAELEQEMKDLEAAGTVTETTIDSTASQEPMADAEAVPEETLATQPEALAMPSAPEGEGYTVQIAACENQEYARYLIGVYADRGYDAYASTITYEGQTFHRVRIGNFEGISGARALKDELQDKFSATSWIDRLDQ